METNNSVGLDEYVHINEWRNLWEKDDNPPHFRDYVHKLLYSNFSKQAEGRQNLRIFVPLCGKSMDLKWLSEQGHHVVGVEASEVPVRALYKQGFIDHSIEIDGKNKVYTSDDGRIKVFVSDLFQLSRAELGTFDVIWDRAAFVALDKQQEPRYVSLMKSLMAEACRYLISAVDMKKASGEPKTGPPHVTQREDLVKAFGHEYSVSFLEGLDCTPDADPKWEVEWFYENLYLIKKSNT